GRGWLGVAGVVAVMDAIVGARRPVEYSFVPGRKLVVVVLRINVRNEDLTMSRFALSPLWELIQALRLLPGGSRHPDETVLRPWLLRARDRYQELARETDLGVIRALNPPGWGADFLAPLPVSVPTTTGALLEQ